MPQSNSGMSMIGPIATTARDGDGRSLVILVDHWMPARRPMKGYISARLRPNSPAARNTLASAVAISGRVRSRSAGTLRSATRFRPGCSPATCQAGSGALRPASTARRCSDALATRRGSASSASALASSASKSSTSCAEASAIDCRIRVRRKRSACASRTRSRAACCACAERNSIQLRTTSATRVMRAPCRPAVAVSSCALATRWADER